MDAWVERSENGKSSWAEFFPNLLLYDRGVDIKKKLSSDR